MRVGHHPRQHVEQVEVALDGLVLLEPATDVAVEGRAERVRKTLVCDLVGDRVLEEPRLVVLSVDLDEVERP